MQLDINLVGLLAMILAGFSFFVRLTIKSSISDLKDTLATTYMSRKEITAEIESIHHRLSLLEQRLLGTNAS